MLCPKCKKETNDNEQRCVHCGARINVICPACHTINPIGTRECKKCHFKLLKYCPKCNAANNPKAEVCRKCSAQLEVKKSAIIASQKKINEVPTKIRLSQSTLNKLHSYSEQVEKVQTSPISDNIQKQPLVQQPISTFVESPNLEQEIDEKNKITVQEDIINETGTETIPLPVIEEDEKVVSIEVPEEKEEKTIEQVEEKDSLKQEDTENSNEIEAVEPVASDTLMENITSSLEQINQEDSTPLKDEDSSTDEESENLDDDAEFTEPENFLEEDFDIYFQSQQNAKNSLTDALRGTEKCILGLSGADGSGKTYVLREVFNQLQSPDTFWLWGECTPLTQVTTMGAIQDVLVNLFNISLLCADINAFKNDTKKFFAQEFPTLKNNEVDLLINFLYPHKTSYYENIKENRERTFDILEKLFRLIQQRGQIYFIIDDFELIDGSSYDFICRLIENGVINNRFKLIVTYQDTREIEGFISSNLLSPKSFDSVHLGTMSDEELDTIIFSFLKTKDVIPERIIDEIKQNAKGSPAYVESVISYLSEIKAIEFEDEIVSYNKDFNNIEIPESIPDVIKAKLDRFKLNNTNAYKILLNAALLGSKFNIDVLNFACEIGAGEFEECINLLICWGYFMQLNTTTFAFKNNLLWRECYDYAKNDSLYAEYNRKLIDVLDGSILTNNSLKALLVQNINSSEECFEYWTENTKLASYIGDVSLYVISQKQSLKYLEEYKCENENLIKNNIYERIGKLLSESAPAQAMEFLSNAIVIAENDGNVLKIIDLSAYLGVAAQLLDNYLGVIEVVDLVLKYIKKEENPLGWALIKQKKLSAILTMGNSAELIDIAENDIIPVLRNYVYSPKNNFAIAADFIYKGWIETNLALAETYTLQGSNRAIAILCSLSDMLEAHKIDNCAYVINIEIIKALYYTINGQVKKSVEILRNISNQNYGVAFDAKLRSKWNLVNALNKFSLHQYDKLTAEIFDVVAFANNCGDNFTKNILKLIFGRIEREKGNISKAAKIYDEQVTWFAESKIAIGAMLSWWFIVESTLQTDGTSKALEIALKALDVAKNPKIKNYYFMILFKMQIAEIYLTRGDLESAKMYTEKALLIAKKGDLYDLKVKLHLLYGKCFERIIETSKSKSYELKPRIKKNYETALGIARKIESAELLQEVQAAISDFKKILK